MITPVKGQKIIWGPQVGPQTLACACPCDEIFYGGQAGGGKSDLIIGRLAGRERIYGADIRAVIFRRTYKQLEEIEHRAKEIYFPVYGMDCYSISRKQFTLPSGATIKLRAMEDRDDVLNHQGHQYTDIHFDELTHWPDDHWYEYLLTRSRSAAGVPCQTVSTSNPGNAGHNWVKERFMVSQETRLRVPPLEIHYRRVPNSNRKRSVIFIPAKLEDNRILMDNDPGYRDVLNSISDPIMRRALAEGDWDAIAGTAFPELRDDVHKISNVLPPTGCEVYCAMDWGYVKPYSVGWFFRGSSGQIIHFAEMYGLGPKPNVGVEEAPSVVWEKILNFEREMGFRSIERWADPQAFGERDGDASVIDLMGGEAIWQPWPKGPRSRIRQKSRCHEFFKVVNNASRFLVCERCTNWWRTMSVLPLDNNGSGDVDTDAEDHAYDMTRGFLAKNILSKDQMDVMRAVVAESEAAVYGPAGGMGSW